MRHYVTLFDKNYLAKGLNLYNSLESHSSEPFRLWILPLDNETNLYLRSLDYPNINLLHFPELSKEAKENKKKFPIPYFFFSLAPEVCCHLLKELNKDVTYLDADTYFFADPEIAWKEMGDKDVAIVSHNFPDHDFERLIYAAGHYNVSWVTFKATELGKQMAYAWRDAVRKKCDTETCGDQLYLNQFPDVLGERLHVFNGIQIGAGPWNIYTYKCDRGPTVNDKPLVYYHFHELKVDGLNTYLTGYPLTNLNKEFIYVPYLRTYEIIEGHINQKKNEGFFNHA